MSIKLLILCILVLSAITIAIIVLMLKKKKSKYKVLIAPVCISLVFILMLFFRRYNTKVNLDDVLYKEHEEITLILEKYINCVVEDKMHTQTDTLFAIFGSKICVMVCLIIYDVLGKDEYEELITKYRRHQNNMKKLENNYKSSIEELQDKIALYSANAQEAKESIYSDFFENEMTAYFIYMPLNSNDAEKIIFNTYIILHRCDKLLQAINKDIKNIDNKTNVAMILQLIRESIIAIGKDCVYQYIEDEKNDSNFLNAYKHIIAYLIKVTAQYKEIWGTVQYDNLDKIKGSIYIINTVKEKLNKFKEALAYEEYLNISSNLDVLSDELDSICQNSKTMISSVQNMM